MEMMQLVEREEMVEEDDEFSSSLQNLTAQGLITGGDVRKLHVAGIYSCKRLMKHTKENLTEIFGLSEAKVNIIWEAAEKIVEEARNRRKTINTIGRKHLMQTFLGKRKRIEELKISIRLNSILRGNRWVVDPRRKGQTDHWNPARER